MPGQSEDKTLHYIREVCLTPPRSSIEAEKIQQLLMENEKLQEQTINVKESLNYMEQFIFNINALKECLENRESWTELDHEILAARLDKIRETLIKYND